MTFPINSILMVFVKFVLITGMISSACLVLWILVGWIKDMIDYRKIKNADGCVTKKGIIKTIKRENREKNDIDKIMEKYYGRKK